LGSGTSGKVYQGLYKGKEEVAVKVMEVDDETSLSDFKKEFEIMRHFKSPYLVKFYGACIEPSICLVMELCQRGSLKDVLEARMFIGWNRVFQWFEELLQAIQTLHDSNCVHRDIKKFKYSM